LEVLGLIPARGGSKGIQGKNTRPLGGTPLIALTFSAALRCGALSRRILTTDSEQIAELGRRHGIEVPFLRPAAISGDASPAADYVLHCLGFLAERGYRPDVVVLLQPTTPFRTPRDIDACVELLTGSSADSVVSVTQLESKYHPGWQFVIEEGKLLPFSGSWSGLATHRQHIAPTFTRNGAVYAFWTRVFEATGGFYGQNVLPYVMDSASSVNIDGPEDWRKAELVLQGMAGGRTER
jgi:CMP-N-acetylneuraminic acid synthetase